MSSLVLVERWRRYLSSSLAVRSIAYFEEAAVSQSNGTQHVLMDDARRCLYVVIQLIKWMLHTRNRSLFILPVLLDPNHALSELAYSWSSIGRFCNWLVSTMNGGTASPIALWQHIPVIWGISLSLRSKMPWFVIVNTFFYYRREHCFVSPKQKWTWAIFDQFLVQSVKIFD